MQMRNLCVTTLSWLLVSGLAWLWPGNPFVLVHALQAFDLFHIYSILLPGFILTGFTQSWEDRGAVLSFCESIPFPANCISRMRNM